MAYRIREMRESDLPAVAELAVQLGYPVAVDDLAARFRSIAEEADHAVFVAEEDATIVGWVHVHGSRLLVAPPRAGLGGLVVRSGFRARGAGGPWKTTHVFEKPVGSRVSDRGGRRRPRRRRAPRRTPG